MHDRGDRGDRGHPRDAALQKAVSRVFRQVKDTDIFLAILTRATNQDPQALMEIGMAVVLDKPVLLLIPEGLALPENLRRMARAVETFRSPDDVGLATERLLAFAHRHRLFPS